MVASVVEASISDYEKYFIVDMDKKLPSINQLKKTYFEEEKLYDSHYNSYWDISEVFDKAFYAKMATYAGQEKRLKTETEDDILEMIALMPKEHYQYIGPMLHTVPGMSDKVLNLPGIKETKNKFPTVIAEQAKNIEGLEFLSPFLYFMLMPEVWGEKTSSIEFPKPKKNNSKLRIKADYFNNISKVIEHYNLKPKKDKNKIVRGDFRTINPKRNSLLTSKDVQAFMGTLDDVNDFYLEGDNRLLLSQAMVLQGQYEVDEGDGLPVNGLKDIVNPCQRLVQRIKIIGKEREFNSTISKSGFDIKEWAYTCDKTVKAYRLATINSDLLLTLKSYKKGYFDSSINKLNKKHQMAQYSGMRAMIEMYNAPLNDVLEVLKNKQELLKKFNKYKNRVAGAPVDRLQ